MKRYNIALVAHDNRKQELLEWVKFNAPVLTRHNLFATGTTGSLIKKAFADMDDSFDDEREKKIFYDQKVNCLLSGPLGGDFQIGAMIAEGKIDILIFFCDNLVIQGHQNDISALGRIASLYNIAYATNRTTADMILTSSLFENESYERLIPEAIESYKNRKLDGMDL